MSALAEIMLDRGYTVSGYDLHKSELCDRLNSLGIPIYYEFDENMYKDIDLVVCTNAIHEDDIIRKYPEQHGIECVSRGEFLGELMKLSKNRIGIAGTHGKSTTTGMISEIFLTARRDPTILVGAVLPEIDSTFRIGGGDDFIFESCEYMDSFLSFFPTVSVVLNVEHDHVDYFPTVDDVIASFHRYICIPGKDGYAVVNADSEHAMKALENCDVHAVTYSALGADAEVTAENITVSGGFPEFDVYVKGEFFTHIRLSVPGRFNVGNALAAVAVGRIYSIEPDVIRDGIARYKGVKRRFEIRGRLGDATVVDDYAHHPDEIKATMSSALDSGIRPITVVFQSHTFTRTKALFSEFCTAFTGADEVVFADIYPAREQPIEGVTAEALAKATPNGKYVGSFDDIADYLKRNVREGMIIVMGAGDVIEITDKLLEDK